MIKEAKRILEEYYRLIDIVPEKTRKQEQVKARAAMMVAMRDHMTATDIGKLFESDHSTVVHHTGNHQANMKHWLGYKANFSIAWRLCNDSLRMKSYQGKLATVKLRIQHLKMYQQELEELIQSQKNEQLSI